MRNGTEQAVCRDRDKGLLLMPKEEAAAVMNSEKNLRVSVLLDYYAPMLTDKQKDVIDLYYNEDLSLDRKSVV